MKGRGHDQALRLANKGYTPLEAAEVIALPDELAHKSYNGSAFRRRPS